MTPAAILRAQMSTSTDPARLEREARLIEAREAGVFAAGAGMTLPTRACGNFFGPLAVAEAQSLARKETRDSAVRLRSATA